MLKICLILIIAFRLSDTIVSQTKNSYSYIDSISYRIKLDDVLIGKKISFKFPPLENGPYLLEAIEAKSIKDNNLNPVGVFYGCKILLANKFLITHNQNLNIKFYSTNIDSLFVSLYTDNKLKNIVKCIPLKKQISYFNFNLALDTCFKRHDGLLSPRNPKQNEIAVNVIKIYYKHKENQKLIIGDLTISKPVKVQGANQQEFVRNILSKYTIIKNNEEFKGITNLTTEKNIDLLGIIPENILKSNIKEELIKDENKEDLICRKSIEKNDFAGVSKAIRNILVDYFHSTENKRDYLIKEYDIIVQNTISLDDFYEKLKKFIPKLEDTHIYLTNEKIQREEDITLPIYFYDINNEFQVVGILDPSFVNVSLGDKLLSINNIPILTIVDNIKKYTVGTNDHAKKMKILQKLLYYACTEFGGVLNLELQNIEKKNYTVQLTLDQVLRNKNIHIPDNFVQSKKRLDYKKINNYSYLKIGQFKNGDIRPFFYSVIDSILKSDGLIIDLRNNSGGDISAPFLFSFFIQSPSIFFTSFEKKYHETLIVKPDPYYYFPNPIVIIFDARTTCGSEFFINALLKARADVVTIATEKSAGSAQRITYLDLPETNKFKGTLMYRNSIFFDAFGNNIDLSGGLKPDIWTGFDSYLDLAPYDDKLLNFAIKYLDEKVKSNKNKLEKKENNMYILITILGILFILSAYLFRKRIKNSFKIISKPTN